MDNEVINQEPMPQVSAPDAAPMLPAPQETGQAAAPEAARSSCWQAAWRVIFLLIKIGLFVLVIAALAAAYYWGWPKVYQAYILPVQENTARMAVLEKSAQASQDQLHALQTQLPALAASQSGQSATLTALAPRLSAVESSVKEQNQAQSEQAAAITALAPRLSTLESSSKEQAQALTVLQSTQTALQSGGASQRAELERQVALLKSMELLSRARLFLYQSNFGLAKQDVQAARDLLAGTLESAGQQSNKDLPEVIQHLDQVIARLPDYPVAASDELDAAWQILLGGPAQPTATPTPEAESR